jgi:AraC-like DNA-binding protein
MNIYSVIQCFFLGAVLLHTRKNRLSNRILASIIVLFSVCMVFWFFYHLKNYAAARIMAYVDMALFPSFGPLIYFYILSMTGTMTRFSWNKLIHFLPVIPFCIFTLRFDVIIMPNGISGIDIRQLIIFTSIVLCILVIQLLYFARSFLQLYRHDKRIRDVYSDISGIKSKFLYLFLEGSMVLGLLTIFLFMMLINNMIETITGHIIQFVFYIIYLSLTLLATFISIRHPKALKVIEVEKVKKTYGTSKIEKSQLEEYRNKIINCMEKERPYLDDSLTLKDFSERVGVPHYYVSMTLNTCLKQNFYTFINMYRIEEVKRLFSDPEYSHHTVLRIAFESGFNSKTAFNTMFKKFNGIPPSQYRKKRF